MKISPPYLDYPVEGMITRWLATDAGRLVATTTSGAIAATWRVLYEDKISTPRIEVFTPQQTSLLNKTAILNHDGSISPRPESDFDNCKGIWR